MQIRRIGIFAAIYFYDRSRGGYRKEVLVQEHPDPDAEVAAGTGLQVGNTARTR